MNNFKLRLRMKTCEYLPHLRFTILCILNASDNPRDFFSEISKFFLDNRKSMFPFLYPQFVFVIPGQLYETKSPIVAILSTNGKMPKEIDTSQLRCIGHSSDCPRSDGADTVDLNSWEISDYLDCYHEKLPNLTALVNCKKGTDLRKLEKCKTSSQLTSLNLSRCTMIRNCHDLEKNPYYSFHYLQELDTTMKHFCGAVNLPEFKNLKKLTLCLSDTKKSLKDFKSNQFKFLKYLKVPCGSATDTSYYGFGLPDTSCLETFKSNATPKQARFTVYGTEDDNGVFIPGNDNWVLNLREVKTNPEFFWFVQTSKYVFKKRRFNDVPLREDVVIKHYYVKTFSNHYDVETEERDTEETVSDRSDSDTEDDQSSNSDIEEIEYVLS